MRKLDNNIEICNFSGCINLKNLCSERRVKPIVSRKSEIRNFQGLILVHEDILRFYIAVDYIVAIVN